MLFSMDVKESGALQLAEMLRSRLLEIDLGPGAQCYVVPPFTFVPNRIHVISEPDMGIGGSRYSMNHHNRHHIKES